MLFHLTRHCSMNCTHCFVDAIKDEQHTSMEVIKKLIAFVKEYNIVKLGIAGGEPTEHPAFFPLFEYILANTNSIVILMTNGQIFLDDYETKRLSKLKKIYKFFIQVTSIPDIYPQYNAIIKGIKKANKRFKNMDIEVVEKLTCMEPKLGRAKNHEWDMNEYHERKVPMCFNTHIIARQVGNFEVLMESIDKHTKNFCSPFIDHLGNMYAGESPFCQKVGHIDDNPQELFKRFETMEPCMKCGSGDKKLIDLMIKRFK